MRGIRDGKPTFVVVDVPEDATGAEVVVGFAQWEPPSQSPPSPAAVFATNDPIPGSFDQHKAEVLFRLMMDETKKALGPNGHSNMWCKFTSLCNPPSRVNPNLTVCLYASAHAHRG
jgi:hypothetical protein